MTISLIVRIAFPRIAKPLARRAAEENIDAPFCRSGEVPVGHSCQVGSSVWRGREISAIGPRRKFVGVDKQRLFRFAPLVEWFDRSTRTGVELNHAELASRSPGPHPAPICF